MSQNFQLSDILHVLLHMAQREGPTTSEALAAAMNTNPVVLRRLMIGMRSAGFVVSGKGHGGGWALSCDLERITIGDVYQALGAPRLISLGFREDQPTCLVAAAVNDALTTVIQDAEALLLRRFGEVTLATLSADLHLRLKHHMKQAHHSTHQLEDHVHENS